MIGLARERASGVGDRCEFVVGDILDFCSAEKFDFSIVMGVMDYIDAPDQMIEKVKFFRSLSRTPQQPTPPTVSPCGVWLT